MTRPLVGIILGSASDEPKMAAAGAELERLGIPYEQVVASAHRAPKKVTAWIGAMEEAGCQVIIAGAGKAAHLPGVVASQTSLPVIGVPMSTPDLRGLDSLLSIVQMPPGVPVACVAIDGAKNAAILASQIIALTNPKVRQAVTQAKAEMAGA